MLYMLTFWKPAEKNKLKAAFTTSEDIVGPGKCQSYWYIKSGQWLKSTDTAYSELIFDKFSPTNKKIKSKRALLFSSSHIKLFNNPLLFDMCFDKQKTYNKLKKFCIPTVSLSKISAKSIKELYKILDKKISKYQFSADFSQEVIIKDRFGAGGNNIYKFKRNQIDNITKLLKKHKKISFIIQPFTKFNEGFKFENISVSVEFRLIYLENTVIQSYLRIAKKGDFRCNEHRGGLLKYVSIKDIPPKVIDLANKVIKKLDNKASLYALDFIISNQGNVYLLEANTGPGLDWNQSSKENELEAKKLINIITSELAKRAFINNRKDIEFPKELIYLPV